MHRLFGQRPPKGLFSRYLYKQRNGFTIPHEDVGKSFRDAIFFFGYQCIVNVVYDSDVYVS